MSVERTLQEIREHAVDNNDGKASMAADREWLLRYIDVGFDLARELDRKAFDNSTFLIVAGTFVFGIVIGVVAGGAA